MSPSYSYVNDTCLTDCAVECGAHTHAPTGDNGGDGLFQTNWYTRASAIAMYTLWAGYFTTWVVVSVLFFWLRKIQPIKSRSPLLVLISGFGGLWIVTNNAMSMYVTGIQNWPCPFSNWSLFIAFPLFLLPFPLRSLQLYLIFRKNIDKIENHLNATKNTSRRVTVVESKRKPTTGASVGNQLAPSPREAGSDFEMTKEDAAEETRNKPARSLQPGAGSIVFLTELNSKKDNATATTQAGDFMRQSGMQNVQAELGLQSRTFLENHVKTIFGVILLLCFIAAFARQMVPSLGLGPECRGCMVSATGAITQILIVLIIIAVSVFSTAFMHYSSVEDQYRIRLELNLITLVWIMFLVPACVLAEMGGGCEALRLQSASCLAFDTFTQSCYTTFAAQYWVIAVCVVITFCVTMVLPVIYTLINAKNKLTGEVSLKWPNVKALTSAVECLKEQEAAEAFQKFCVQAFCIESFLFYKDVQAYRSIADPIEMRIKSLAIYRQYIDVNGNLFLTLPDAIQLDLDNKLASFAEQEEERGDGRFDYNFEPTKDIFNQAQEFVLAQLEADTFPRFQASDIAKQLAKAYSERIVHQMGLASAHLA